MFRNGNQVRLTSKQREVIKLLLGEDHDPHTRAEARIVFERAALAADDGSKEGNCLKVAFEELAKEMAESV